MKFLVALLAVTALNSAYAECFFLNAQSASEADKVCVNEQFAEVFTREKYLLDTIPLKKSVDIVNVGHGVGWRIVTSSGKGKSYEVLATKNGQNRMRLIRLTNLQTGKSQREYVPTPYTGGPQGCVPGRRCI